MPLNAHWLIQKQAREMAAELFEVYAPDNDLYRLLRSGQVLLNGRQVTSEKQARRVFVHQMAPKLYEEARGLLTDMLAMPEDRVPQSLKDQIAQALIMDNDLRGNRLVRGDQATIPKVLH